MKPVKVTGTGSYRPINIIQRERFLSRKRPYIDIIIFDEFTDSNGTLLASHTAAPINKPGGSWTKTGGSGDTTIENNKAEASTTSGAINIIDTGVNDYTVSCDMDTPAEDVSIFWGPIVRSDNTSTGYFAAWLNPFSDTMSIYEDGVTVRASQAFTVNINTNYEVKAQCRGSSITMTVNGGSALSYGSAATNRSYVGTMKVAAQLRRVTWDNFKVTVP